MSRVTDQLDRIEAKIGANNIKEGVVGLANSDLMNNIFENIEELKTKLNEIGQTIIINQLDKEIDCDGDDVVDDIIDNQADYIHFLENELEASYGERDKLRKKNKKLKKRIKTLQEVIAEDEDAL